MTVTASDAFKILVFSRLVLNACKMWLQNSTPIPTDWKKKKFDNFNQGRELWPPERTNENYSPLINWLRKRHLTLCSTSVTFRSLKRVSMKRLNIIIMMISNRNPWIKKWRKKWPKVINRVTRERLRLCLNIARKKRRKCWKERKKKRKFRSLSLLPLPLTLSPPSLSLSRPSLALFLLPLSLSLLPLCLSFSLPRCLCLPIGKNSNGSI